MENKFTAIPLVIPLCPDMPSAYEKIKESTKVLKTNFFTVYAQYALTYIFSAILPKSLSRFFLDDASSKFTIGFSNTPGFIKNSYFIGLNGEKISGIATQTYMVVSGFVGLAVNC